MSLFRRSIQRGVEDGIEQGLRNVQPTIDAAKARIRHEIGRRDAEISALSERVAQLETAIAAAPREDATPGQRVRAFHDAFGVPTPERPGFPSWRRRRLRWKLNIEEKAEADAADGNADLVGVAEEWADQVIVKLGQAWEHGINLELVIAEKMRANMSKLGSDGKPILRADGKVLKGPAYVPADTAGVLRAMGGGWTE